MLWTRPLPRMDARADHLRTQSCPKNGPESRQEMRRARGSRELGHRLDTTVGETQMTRGFEKIRGLWPLGLEHGDRLRNVGFHRSS